MTTKRVLARAAAGIAAAAIVAALMLVVGCTAGARNPGAVPPTSGDAIAPETSACEAFGCTS